MRSDLYGFFNFAQTVNQPCPGGSAGGLRPTGAAFHKLAAIAVALDGQDRITAISLSLDRAFVDAPGQGVFARDVAKSFIRDVAGPAPDPRIGALADEIESGLPPKTTLVPLHGAQPSPQQGPASPCYRVFLGTGASCAIAADGEILTLQDGRPEGDAVVRITFAPKAGAPAGCLLRKIAD
jgi:hypothetical protein